MSAKMSVLTDTINDQKSHHKLIFTTEYPWNKTNLKDVLKPVYKKEETDVSDEKDTGLINKSPVTRPTTTNTDVATPSSTMTLSPTSAAPLVSAPFPTPSPVPSSSSALVSASYALIPSVTSATTSTTNTLSKHKFLSPKQVHYMKQLKSVEKQVEFLLQENKDRFLILPIKYQDLWDKYEAQMKCIWQVAEVTSALHVDCEHYRKQSSSVTRPLALALAFFANSDGIVTENLATRFMREVMIPEARFFYGTQTMMENIHAQTYQQLLTSIIKDPKERLNLMHAIETIPVVKDKAEWALQWIDNEEMPFALRLLAFAIVEGLHFSTSFALIFWYRSRRLFPAVVKSNEFISRDEGLHTDFAILLYSKIKNRIPTDVIHAMFQSAAELEKNFVHDLLGDGGTLGISEQSMSSYVEYVSDRLLKQLEYPPLFCAEKENGMMECPLDWMINIGIRGKSNFHEQTVTEYAKVIKTMTS